jgi:hypothetical protein
MLNGEAKNTNFKVFDLTRLGLEHMIYHNRGELDNYYTTYRIQLVLTPKFPSIPVIDYIVIKEFASYGELLVL